MPWRRSTAVHVVRALAYAVDIKGGYVPGHSDGVAYLIGMMGAEAGYSKEYLAQLEIACLLHDTGKLRIPDSILLAERTLTEAEYDVMKSHPGWSAEIAGAVNGVEFAVPWVRHHHERFDGKGYPDGLKAEDIPWESRLIFAADAFHVITTDRPYQAARTRSEAIDLLQELAGSQFCPAAVALLVARQEGGGNYVR